MSEDLVRVTKTRGTWVVSGLIGLNQDQVDSVIRQILLDTDLTGDIRVLVQTRSGMETYSVADLSNDSVRSLLLSKL